MVVKLLKIVLKYCHWFESSVILNGSKTRLSYTIGLPVFESSVILNGSKTMLYMTGNGCRFESSVILNGSKTITP